MNTHRTLRHRHLARIHILSARLGLSRETYKLVLFALTGHRTSTTLNEVGRMRVISFLQGELTRTNPPTTEPAVVSDEEAAEILGIAA